MDGSLSSNFHPAVRRHSAARHTRDLRDIRLLKYRVPEAAKLSSDLIDMGAGNFNQAHEQEAALLNPGFAFTPRERADLQANADSHRGLEMACREELAALPAWSDQAKFSTWADLAREAARREAA